MRLGELRKKLQGFDNDFEVWFFNPDENEGSRFYEILTVELTKNDEGVLGCVLTDEPEGIHRR